MKKFALMIAGLGIATVALPAAASAAPWASINQRQAQVDRRIDVGIRNGSLTRNEASRLRYQFRQLSVLENRYRASGRGLSVGERRDLDNRFTALSQRVRNQRHDRQDYRRR